LGDDNQREPTEISVGGPKNRGKRKRGVKSASDRHMKRFYTHPPRRWGGVRIPKFWEALEAGRDEKGGGQAKKTNPKGLGEGEDLGETVFEATISLKRKRGKRGRIGLPRKTLDEQVSKNGGEEGLKKAQFTSEGRTEVPLVGTAHRKKKSDSRGGCTPFRRDTGAAMKYGRWRVRRGGGKSGARC